MENLGKIVFNQGTYTGEIANKCAEGYGCLKFENGDLYMGQFKSNCMTGIGFYYTKDSWTLGNFINGKRNGKCLTIIKKSSYEYDFFIGNYQNDVKSGQGAYYWHNEDCYVGEFYNDQPNGYGSMSEFGGNSFYSGTFKNGSIIKQSVFYPKTELPNDYIFFGNCDQHYHYYGEGLLVSKQGKLRLIGEHNKLGPNLKISYNFKGVHAGGNRIRCGAQSKYLTIGDFGPVNSRKNGSFEKIYANGNMYMGQYVEDNKNGFGVFYDGTLNSRSTGAVYIGRFANGKLVDGVHIFDKFLLIAKGKFKGNTPCDGLSLYDTSEVLLAKNGQVRSIRASLPTYNGVLNSDNSYSYTAEDPISYENYVPTVSPYRADGSVKTLEEQEKEEQREKNKYIRKALMLRMKPLEEKLRRQQEAKEQIKERDRRIREEFEAAKERERILRERYWESYKKTGFFVPDKDTAHKISGFNKEYAAKELEIPKTTKYIGAGAFKGATIIEKLTSHSSLIKIEDEAFRDCKDLVEIDLSKSLIKELKCRAFVGCSNLETIKLPYGFKTVNRSDFQGCDKLKKIFVDDKEMDLESFLQKYAAHENLNNYSFIDENEYYKGTPKFYCEKGCIHYVRPSEVNEIIIFPKYKEIKNKAFKDVCKNVTKLVILSPNLKFPPQLLNGLIKLKEFDVSNMELINFGSLSFKDCKELEIIRLPDSFDITTITYIFGYIESLKKIYYKDLILDEFNIFKIIKEINKK